MSEIRELGDGEASFPQTAVFDPVNLHLCLCICVFVYLCTCVFVFISAAGCLLTRRNIGGVQQGDRLPLLQSNSRLSNGNYSNTKQIQKSKD